MNTARRSIFGWAAVIVVVLASSCSDGDVTSVDSSGIGGLARWAVTPRTPEDSASFLAGGSESGPTVAQTVAVLVKAGDTVAIALIDSECASQGTVLSVSGPVSGVISTDACNDPDASITLGPSPSDGELNFVMDDPRFGSGSFMAEGAYPSYTVFMEDGFGDGDFNDAILSVVMTPGEEPEPELTCTSNPERGQEVTCTVSPATVVVLGWEFRGGGATVTAPGGSNVWAGTAVVGGNVEVEAEIDGEDETLKASFDVQDRDWRWSQADWSFQQGAAPVLGSSGIPASDGGVRWRLGYNCTLPDCMRGSILPDLTQGESGGYGIAEVASGPNQGFWYVTSAQFQMMRGSNLNQHVKQGAALRFPLTPNQVASCSSLAPDPDGTVRANWYTFNDTCQGFPVVDFLNAAWAHEGFGTNGSNGHEAQRWKAASQEKNDPRRILEPLHDRNAGALEAEILRVFSVAQGRIERAAGREPRGNWPSSTIWAWSFRRQEYRRVRINGF